jgi:hypothetical protein
LLHTAAGSLQAGRGGIDQPERCRRTAAFHGFHLESGYPAESLSNRNLARAVLLNVMAQRTHAKTHGAERGVNRMEGSSDVVFAIALTLLIVEIKVTRFARA